MRKQFFTAPAAFESPVDRAAFNPALSCPLGKRFGCSIVRVENIGTRVVALNADRGPPTILWRIGTVVVDAVYRHFWAGAFPHVFKKLKEGIHPALADDNPAPPVTFETCSARVRTTIPHADPQPIFRGVVHSASAWRGARSFQHFYAKAPARPGASIAEKFAGHDSFRSALTETEPLEMLARIVWCLRDYFQTTKASAYQVLNRVMHPLMVAHKMP